MTREPDEALVDAAIARLEKEELERVMKLSPAEVAEEMRALGLAPDAGLAVARRALAASEVGRAAKVAPDEDLLEGALGRLEAEEEAQARAQTQAQAEARPEPNRGEGRERPKVVPLRPRPSQRWSRFAAAAAVLGPVGLLALSEIGEPIILVGSAPDAGAESVEAAAIRSEAADALEAGQWARCIELLDAAKKKDPKGDEAPGVQDVRRIAMRKLGKVDAPRE